MSEEMYGKDLLELKYEEAVEDFDDQVVNMTYEVFISKLYSELKTKIPKAFKERNFQDLKVFFHNFKTTSRYLGAENFSNLCNGLQLCCKEGKEDITKLEKLYPIFMLNFDRFYHRCKKQYYKIMNIEADDSEEDSGVSSSDDSYSDFESEEEKKEKEEEKEKTPRFRSRLSIKNEINFQKPRFNSPRRRIPKAKRDESFLDLISAKFSNDEKLTIPYNNLISINNKEEVNEIICKYIYNYSQNQSFMTSLKIAIQNQENEKIIEALHKIKDCLKYVLRDKSKLYLTQCINFLSQENCKSQIDLMEKIEKLNQEITAMYDENCAKSHSQTSEKKKQKKTAAFRSIEVINNTNLVSIPESSSSLSTSLFSSDNCIAGTNYFEMLKEIELIEVSIDSAVHNSDLQELIDSLANFKTFTIKYKYKNAERNLERCIERLNNYNTYEECKFNYSRIKEDLNSIKAELEDFSSRTPIEVYEENSNKVILESFKPVNSAWYSSFNLEKFEESEEAEEKGKAEKKKSYRKLSEDTDIFNYPFKSGGSQICSIF